MLGVSLSSFNGLYTVTTKYVIKINEFPSFRFCNDNILVSPSIVLCAIDMWINSAVTALFIFKTYDKSNAFIKNKYKYSWFFSEGRNNKVLQELHNIPAFLEHVLIQLMSKINWWEIPLQGSVRVCLKTIWQCKLIA